MGSREGHEKSIVAMANFLPSWMERAATQKTWDGGSENPVLLKVDPVQAEKSSPSRVMTDKTDQDRRGVALRELYSTRWHAAHRNPSLGAWSPEPRALCLFGMLRAWCGTAAFPTRVNTSQ